TNLSPESGPSIYLIKKDNISIQKSEIELAIEEVYKNYPLKKGKTVGVKRLLRQINSEEKLNQLRQAIKNYASECKGKEPQYIKHFSTFANCWQDYLEAPSPAKSDWIIKLATITASDLGTPTALKVFAIKSSAAPTDK
ncbi:MAG: hypothetical protein EBW80_08340, partial [Burkholderiaceae bacterium]|nr:hypothetical protein [Burkholderiaceae bacterium]